MFNNLLEMDASMLETSGNRDSRRSELIKDFFYEENNKKKLNSADHVLKNDVVVYDCLKRQNKKEEKSVRGN